VNVSDVQAAADSSVLGNGQLSPRQREILDAAAQIFHEKGYEATSIQDVADAVGILKGSLYYYIDSKEDLLFGIIDEVHRTSLAHLERWQRIDGDALVKLRAFITGHVMGNVNNLVKMGVFFHDFRSLSPERRAVIVEERDVYDQFLRNLIVEGQKEGVIDEAVDPKLAAMAILGMMNWIYQWWRPDGPNTAEEVAEEFADLVLSGLVVRRGRARRKVGALPPGFQELVGMGPSADASVDGGSKAPRAGSTKASAKPKAKPKAKAKPKTKPKGKGSTRGS
jgi:TetR/AcrR family transcriptional regulator, cholesterol catabolism regulator